MANPFSITITAVDKATATVRKINQSVNRLTSPVRNLGQSLGALGRETGLDKVGKSLGKVASSARNAVTSVTSMVPALGAIAGIGSVAGIAALANNWGKLGAEISKTSAILGISTSDLQAYQAASRLAGGSAEDMTGALKSLGDTLEDATFNRNSQALILMNQLGISLTRTKGGAVDATRALRQVAEAVSRQQGNVQAQRLIARTFGVEQLLPLLQKGAKGIEAYVAQARLLGSVMGPEQIAAARDYAQNMTKLEIAVDGLKASIGNALIPVLSPLIEQLSQWVTQNRELIATKVADFVQDVAQWVKSVNWKKVGDDIGGFVDALGGVKGVAIALAAITFAAPIAGVLSLIGHVTRLGLLLTPLAANPIVAGILGLTYSKGLNKGEDAELARRRAMPPTITGGATPPGGGMPAGGTSNGAASSKDLFGRLESQYGLPSGLLDNVWATESSRGKNMNPSAAGAEGHFQFMPATAKQYGVANPYDLEQSATGAAKMYSDLLKSTGGDLPKALAAYNWGIGNVQRKGLDQAPAETRDYIKKVTGGMSGDQAPMSSLYAGADGRRGQGATVGAASAAQGGGKVVVEVVLAGATQGVKASVKTSGNVEATTRVREPMLTENVV